MSIGSITPGLKQFIARYIRSVEQVEVLRLLSSNPNRTWSVAEVFRDIQSSEKSVAECLAGFHQAELLESEHPQVYRYAPKTAELAQAVSELNTAYRERRVTVIEMIYGKPGDPIQDFADAFKFRKEE